jgi:hypothetical protein
LNYGKTTLPEIYDLVSHKRKRPFLNPESKELLMTQGQFSVDGSTVTAQLNAGNVYHTVRIDVKNGKVIEDKRELAELDYRAGVLSGDRKLSVVDRSVNVNGVSAWQLEVWNTESTTLISKMPPIRGYQPVLSKAFSHDNKFLVGGCKDYTVKVWDASTGKLIHSLKGHSSWVVSAIFNNDDSRIFSAASDGSVKIWATTTGKEIATLVTLGDKEFLIKTPDNYFYASKEAYKQIGFRMNGRVFPFEQFDLRLNRPDIVLERLGTASPQLIGTFKNAYLKRLKKLNFTEEMLGKEYHVPEALIVGNEVPYSSATREFKFTIQGKDSLYYLERFNVYVNDVPVYGIKGMSLREKKVKQYQHDVAFTLSNGDNKIQFSFLNEKGSESIRETFYVNYGGAVVNPDLYVVSIGISDYTNNDMDLKYASKDAKDLAKMYEDKLKGPHRYNTIKTLKILDKEATRENILKCKQFLAQSKVDDEVIIFIAGHGLLDEKLDYYLATTDVNFENPAERGLLYEDFEGILDYVPSRHRLIMIDACHSGEVDKENVVLESSTKTTEGTVASRGFKTIKRTEGVGIEGSFELMTQVFADLSKGSGAMVISSASGVEFAFESAEWKNGVFTYAVLEGLKTKKADGNGNSEIKVSELRDYVIERVSELTKGKQHPTSRKENLEFDFKVW